MGCVFLFLMLNFWLNFCLAQRQKAIIDSTKPLWLHPPQTPSTFCMTLQRVFYPDLFANLTKFPETVTVIPDISCDSIEGVPTTFNQGFGGFTGGEENSHRYYTILRDPHNRAVSGFLDDVRTDGMTKDSRVKLMQQISAVYRGKITLEMPYSSAAAALNVYETFPANQGCQMKMILGYQCNQLLNLTRPMISQAITRLSRFAFIGIFEDYSRSIELLRISHNVTVPASHFESMHFRKHPFDGSPLYQYLDAIPDVVDPFDTALYEAAKLLYRQRLAHYGLTAYHHHHHGGN